MDKELIKNLITKANRYFPPTVIFFILDKTNEYQLLSMLFFSLSYAFLLEFFIDEIIRKLGGKKALQNELNQDRNKTERKVFSSVIPKNSIQRHLMIILYLLHFSFMIYSFVLLFENLQYYITWFFIIIGAMSSAYSIYIFTTNLINHFGYVYDKTKSILFEKQS